MPRILPLSFLMAVRRPRARAAAISPGTSAREALCEGDEVAPGFLVVEQDAEVLVPHTAEIAGRPAAGRSDGSHERSAFDFNPLLGSESGTAVGQRL